MKAKEQEIHSELVSFVARFTTLLEKQVADIRTSMEDTVSDILKTVNQISEATAEKKKEANLLIEQTYINPSDDASRLMSSIQSAVDLLVEKQLDVAEEKTDQLPVQVDMEDELLLKNRLKRLKVHFAPAMDGLEHLDGEIKNLLLSIMGSLSADDVIAQRTEHVVNSMHGLQVMLSYLLIDFSRRATGDSVAACKNDLQIYVWDQYTMEEEKSRFMELFPLFTSTAKRSA